MGFLKKTHKHKETPGKRPSKNATLKVLYVWSLLLENKELGLSNLYAGDPSIFYLRIFMFFFRGGISTRKVPPKIFLEKRSSSGQVLLDNHCSILTHHMKNRQKFAQTFHTKKNCVNTAQLVWTPGTLGTPGRRGRRGRRARRGRQGRRGRQARRGRRVSKTFLSAEFF